MHARLASYWKHLQDETEHGLCNAHLLRNLEEIVELEKAPDGWAARMQRLLLEALVGVAPLNPAASTAASTGSGAGTPPCARSPAWPP